MLWGKKLFKKGKAKKRVQKKLKPQWEIIDQARMTKLRKVKPHAHDNPSQRNAEKCHRKEDNEQTLIFTVLLESGCQP